MMMVAALALAVAVAVCCCCSSATHALPTAGTSASKYPPVVLMHGITGEASKLNIVIDWIKNALGDDTYVLSMEIGNGPIDSIFMHMNDQVQEFCDKVYADDNLKEGFNLIGFSQGGLVGRGYIQRCNKYPVINFISWASPQGGVFGLSSGLPKWLSLLLHDLPYSPDVQKSISLAQYWRDPYHLDEYVEKSEFLADLNNERETKNPIYKEHITSLKSMLLVYSDEDDVVNPRESGWFGTFLRFTGPGEHGVIVPLELQQLYIKDYIGLKTLDESGRLKFGVSDCEHQEHPTEACKHIFDQYTLPILEETWNDVDAFRQARAKASTNASRDQPKKLKISTLA